MNFLSQAISNVPARIAVAMAGTLSVMLATVLATRPDMMVMPLSAMQRLVVGFGL